MSREGTNTLQSTILPGSCIKSRYTYLNCFKIVLLPASSAPEKQKLDFFSLFRNLSRAEACLAVQLFDNIYCHFFFFFCGFLHDYLSVQKSAQKETPTLKIV